LENLVTGGAGFIGSHLIEKLLRDKQKVICIDNFSSGRKKNIEKFFSNPNFQFFQQDITKSFDFDVQQIWHLGCPASPKYYLRNPIKTSNINFNGTLNVLELAKKYNSKVLFTSSSEIYGDPIKCPQDENYQGSPNPTGIRSCYSEGKRIAESLSFDYMRLHNIDIKIARIFNTYGPNINENDGRVISNFISAGLRNENLRIFGDGNQTRSFCYINDLIEGLVKLMDSKYNHPINLGNPKEEYQINDLADLIIFKTKSMAKKSYFPFLKDDPKKRKPSIDMANKLLDWHPTTGINEGLDYTIEHFKKINL
tara:strand:- start:1299 stop:2228 length:930 start_codon:yes stop_codon:yes gene_type:complete